MIEIESKLLNRPKHIIFPGFQIYDFLFFILSWPNSQLKLFFCYVTFLWNGKVALGSAVEYDKELEERKKVTAKYISICKVAGILYKKRIFLQKRDRDLFPCKLRGQGLSSKSQATYLSHRGATILSDCYLMRQVMLVYLVCHQMSSSVA